MTDDFIDCETCMGTGLYEPQGIRCPACNGEGVLLNRTPLSERQRRNGKEDDEEEKGNF